MQSRQRERRRNPAPHQAMLERETTNGERPTKVSDLAAALLLIGVFLALAMTLRTVQHRWTRDQQQCSPRQASSPSRTATAAIANAATGSAQYQPNNAFASSPANRTPER